MPSRTSKKLDNLKNLQWLFLLSGVLLLYFSFLPITEAASPLTNQNFDSFTGGSIDNTSDQVPFGDWTGSEAWVTNTTYVSSPNSLVLGYSGYAGNASYTPSSFGQISEMSFWVKFQNVPSNATTQIAIGSGTCGTFGNLQESGTNLQIDEPTGYVTIYSGLTAGTSYFIDEKYNYTNHTSQVNVNNSGWTSWLPWQTNCSDNPTHLYVSDNSYVGYAYFDNFAFAAPTSNFDTITTPAQLSYQNTGQVLFSGTCATPGTYLNLSTSQSVPSFADITCTALGTWQAYENITTTSGENTWYLYDISSSTQTYVNFYSAGVATQYWNIGMQYPVLDGTASAQSVDENSAFPIVLNYQEPVSQNNNLNFIRVEETESNFSTLLSGQAGVPYNENLATGDPSNSDTVTWSYDLTPGAHYFILQLLAGTTNPASVMAQKDVTIVGVTPGTGQPANGGSPLLQCSIFSMQGIINCFIPNAASSVTLQSIFSSISNALTSKWADVTTIQQYMSNQISIMTFESEEDIPPPVGLQVIPSIPCAVPGCTSAPAPAFNSSSLAALAPYAHSVRTLVGYILWLFFIIWEIKLVAYLFNAKEK